MVNYRCPISDSLVKMNRVQLQKFAQYLIAIHPTRVIASAQHLADRLLDLNSAINETSGAPDTTAGAGIKDTPTWYLDEAGVREELRSDFISVAACTFSATHGNSPPALLIPSSPASQRDPSAPGAMLWLFPYGASLHLPQSRQQRSSVMAERRLNDNPQASLTFTQSRTTTSHDFARSWLKNYQSLIARGPSLLTGGTRPLPGSQVASSTPASMTVYPGDQLMRIFAKVTELLTARDSNGPRLLALTTEELIKCSRIPVPKLRRSVRGGLLQDHRSLFQRSPAIEASEEQMTFLGDGDVERGGDGLGFSDSTRPQLAHPRTEISDQPNPAWTLPLWEELVRLWMVFVLTPALSEAVRQRWISKLNSWCLHHRFPQNEAFRVPPLSTRLLREAHLAPHNRSTSGQVPQRFPILQTAVDLGTSFRSTLSNPLSGKRFSLRAILSELSSLPHSTGSLQSASPYSLVDQLLLRLWDCEYSFVALCLRVSALLSTGFAEEATELAVLLSELILVCVEEVSRRALTTTYSRGTPVQPNAVPPDDSMGQPGGMLTASPFQHPSRSRFPNMSRVSSPPGGFMNPLNMRFSPTGRWRAPNFLSVNTCSNGQGYAASSSMRFPALSPLGSANGGPHSVPIWDSRSPPAFRSPPPTLSPRFGHYRHFGQHYQQHHHNPSEGYTGIPSQRVFRSLRFPAYFRCHPYGMPQAPVSLESSSSPACLMTRFQPVWNAPDAPRRIGTSHYALHRPAMPQWSRNNAQNHASSLCTPPSTFNPIDRGVISPPTFTGPSHDTAPIAPTDNSEVTSHDYGWLGLPGRPIIGLIECLFDAAARRVESESSGQPPEANENAHADQPITTQPPVTSRHTSSNPAHFGSITDDTNSLSASYFLNLSLKVGIVALCQQHRLPVSNSCLLTCQTQESRLLMLLDCLPRDSSTARLVSDLVCQLMGLPWWNALPAPSSTSIVWRGPYSGSPASLGGGQSGALLWWWSALGPRIHPDSYPVHMIAEFLLSHLMTGTGSLSAPNAELIYILFARSMRLPMAEFFRDGLESSRTARLQLSVEDESSNLSRDSSAHRNSGQATSLSERTLESQRPFAWPYTSPQAEFSPPLPSAMSTRAIASIQSSLTSDRQTPREPRWSFLQASGPRAPASETYRRGLETMDFKQVRLAVSIILASRAYASRMDQLVRICDHQIKSAVSLLSVSREVFFEVIGHRSAMESSPFDPPSFAISSSQPLTGALLPVVFLPSPIISGSLCQVVHLLSAAFHLALIVAIRTSRRVHWRRREVLAWVVTTALVLGPHAVLHVVERWMEYMDSKEAVNSFAPTVVACLALFADNAEEERCRVWNPTHPPPPALPSNSAHLSQWPRLNPLARVTAGRSRLIETAFIVGAQSSSAGPVSTPRANLPLPIVFPGSPLFSWILHGNSANTQPPKIHGLLQYPPEAHERIATAVRSLATQATAQDPVNCALSSLRLTEKDSSAFETTYRIVLDAAEAGSMGPSQLFLLAHYLESRGFHLQAFSLANLATRLVSLNGSQENHPVAQDVLWACSLAHHIGMSTLEEILPHVVRNVHCPTLLADILSRCRLPLTPSASEYSPHMHCPGSTGCPDLRPAAAVSTSLGHQAEQEAKSSGPLLGVERSPLKELLDATIVAFVSTIHSRLASISPRQYSEFVDFLERARQTFYLLKPDGAAQFRGLLDSLCHSYRGKRKLVALLNARFSN